jgi:hypothetical protein
VSGFFVSISNTQIGNIFNVQIKIIDQKSEQSGIFKHNINERKLIVQAT